MWCHSTESNKNSNNKNNDAVALPMTTDKCKRRSRMRGGELSKLDFFSPTMTPNFSPLRPVI